MVGEWAHSGVAGRRHASGVASNLERIGPMIAAISSRLSTRLVAVRGRLLSRDALKDALTDENAPLVAIALVTFLAHLLVAGNYGYFRDELYYIDAGKHL